MLKQKSVWWPSTSTDGLRILVTRFRGRGMPTNRYHVWMANLGPSEQVLKAMLRGQITWAEFSRRYRKELFEGAPLDKRNATIKNHGVLSQLGHPRLEIRTPC